MDQRFKLIIDDREKKSLDEYIPQTYQYPYEYKRVLHGDFHIVSAIDGRVLAIIERKTWKDLAASMKDGRIQNLEAILLMKQQHNFACILIIEGRKPAPNTLVGKIKGSALFKKIDHIGLEYGFYVKYSASLEHTGTVLSELTDSVVSLYLKDRCFSNGVTVQDTKVDGGIPIDDSKLCSRKKSTELRKSEVWSAIKSIGFHIIPSIIKNHIHLGDLLAKKVPIEKLSVLTYENGGVFGEVRAKRIMKEIQKPSTQIRIMEKVPGWSKQKATIIFNLYSDRGGLMFIAEKIAPAQLREDAGNSGIKLTLKNVQDLFKYVEIDSCDEDSEVDDYYS
jgi:hypothetical protein